MYVWSAVSVESSLHETFFLPLMRFESIIMGVVLTFRDCRTLSVLLLALAKCAPMRGTVSVQSRAHVHV